MTSLVAYEDSETDDDSLDQVEGRSSSPSVRDAEELNVLEETRRPPISTAGPVHAVVEHSSSEQRQMFGASQRHTGPSGPPDVWGGSNTTKRRVTVVPPGVRPYVSKKQRLAASVENTDPKSPAGRAGTSTGHLLSDVSAKVKQHLGDKRGAAQVPRRLVLRLDGHRGPVNRLRWCPLPQLSHLLLSASMDKTFKVQNV